MKVNICKMTLVICIFAAAIVLYKPLNKLDEVSCISNGKLNKDGENYGVCMEDGSVKLYEKGELTCEYILENPAELIMSSCIADINNDKGDEVLLLLKKHGKDFGGTLLILSYSGKFIETYKNSFKDINPWKVQACDVDGDGEKEVSLGVYTRAIFHNVYAKRPFIYNFKQGNLYPKWLGSRLSKPFDDYIFTDIDCDGLDELVSIEILMDGNRELNSYKWKGFGFESIGNSRSFTDIDDISSDKSGITAKVKEDNKWERKVFRYNEGKLVNY